MARIEPCANCNGTKSETIFIQKNGMPNEIFTFEEELPTSTEDKNIQKELENKEIKLYPNPNKGNFYLENTTNEEIQKIKITNINGQTVYEKTNFLSGGIEIPNAKTGFYTVAITLKDKVIYEKIIVE